MTDQGSVVRMQLKGDTLAFSGSVQGRTDQGVDGSVASIRHALGQENLNELKLEVAIAQIEDLIMPMIRHLPANVKLEIHGAELVKIVDLLCEGNGAAIHIEAVESVRTLRQRRSRGLASSRTGNAGFAGTDCSARGHASCRLAFCFLYASRGVKGPLCWTQRSMGSAAGHSTKLNNPHGPQPQRGCDLFP